MHEEALDDFTECTNLQPNEPSYHFFHGGALRTLNRLPEAVTAYTRALSVDSENGDHFNKRGEVYQQLGEHAKVRGWVSEGSRGLEGWAAHATAALVVHAAR